MEEITQEEHSEETPQIESPDNQAELEQLRTELAQIKEASSKHEKAATRNANRANKLEMQLGDIEELKKGREAQDDQLAMILDRLEELGGETTEAPRRQSHYDELQKKRLEKPSAPTPEFSEVAQFAKFIEDNGLTKDSPIVAKAILGTENAGEAMNNLKKLLDEDTETKITKKAEERAKIIAQQMLKEMGIAKGESGPNAASQNDEAFKRDFATGELNDKASFKRMKEYLEKLE